MSKLLLILSRTKKDIITLFVNWLANLLPDFTVFSFLRAYIFRLIAKVGSGTRLMHGTKILDINMLQIGRNCYFGNNVYFDLIGEVKIGDNVKVGYFTKFVTSIHKQKDVEYSGINQSGLGSVIGGNILVEDGAWIGADSIILPNVTIGRNSIVAAGSVVTKNVAPNSMVAGVPAKFIKETHGTIA